MTLIDSHCHLDFTEFDPDRTQILQQCTKIGLEHIIVPAVTARRWPRLLSVCEQTDLLIPALGLHPLFLAQHTPYDLIQLTDLIAQAHPVAIGEIGLDFYIKDLDKNQQIALFKQQLEIAQQAGLPVLLHVRKAHDQVIALLKQYPVPGGIVHAFNGSLEHARHYQKLGFFFGVGGAVTYPKATRLRRIIAALPLCSLVLETDAPDMPLFNQTTPRNTPEHLPLIVRELALLRQETEEEITKTTTQNCRQCLNLCG